MQGNFSTMKNLICHNYISFAKAIFPRSRCEFGREQKTPSRSSRTSQPSEPNTASSIILSFGNVKKGSECRGSCTDTPTKWLRTTERKGWEGWRRRRGTDCTEKLISPQDISLINPLLLVSISHISESPLPPLDPLATFPCPVST